MIGEGMEVIIGKPAAKRGADGKILKDTVHHRVDVRLGKMAKVMQDFGQDFTLASKDEEEV